MPKLSLGQIENLWIHNGGTPGWAPLMAGIALAESGGTTGALNNTPATGDYSVGLWQINYYNGLRSGRTASYGSPTALLASGTLQAKAAISLFGNGAGSSNWQNDHVWNQWQAAGFPQKPNTTTVTGWIKAAGVGGTTTGKVGSPGNAGPTGTATANPTNPTYGQTSHLDATPCLIQFPGVAGLGATCILSRQQAKQLGGGLLVVAGGAVLIFGIALLASSALSSSKLAKQVTGAASNLPGPVGTAAKAVQATGGKSRSGNGNRSQKRQQRSDDRDESQFESTTALRERVARENAQRTKDQRQSAYNRSRGYEKPRNTEDVPFGPQDRIGVTRERRPTASRR